MAEPVCFIKCNHCKRQFPSPFAFKAARTFFTSSLVGNEIHCRECGKMTRCNRENMYFNSRDGTVYHGSETIPE